MQSIRRFLMVMVSVVLITAFLLAMTASYFEARHEVGELFDAELAQTARLLKSSFERVGSRHTSLEEEFKTFSPVKGSPLNGIPLNSDPPAVDSHEERTRFGHRYERKVLFQVRKQDQVLFESEESMLRLDAIPMQGFSDVMVDGYLWYLFTLKDGDYSFTAGERADIRDELAEEILASYMVPLLIILPLLLLLLLWVLKKGLQPLRELASNIRRRGQDNLTPIQMEATPEEIRPVVQALNHLFDQVKHSIELERRFTALASHEMRTPVAVLKLNVQNALNASDETEREQYLQELNQGVDRASRLMEQLLTLSKLEQTDLSYQPQTVDLIALLREEMAALYPLANAKRIQFELTTEQESLPLNTVPQLLSVVLKNLIENAIKYAPAEGAVQVRVGLQNQQIRLSVEDSGQGVPVAQRALIFDRFYRMPDAVEPGAGLGLAIVKRIVDLLGIDIELDDSQDLGGLSVLLTIHLSD
ncbi:MAG: ATP-binding protein [Pseudomonadota bacterium]|nr:ATP-binding protein [Pseudomonadota bacterium]